MTSLTGRALLFVEAYSREPNGSAAAIEAGYAPRSAHVAASRLLRKAKVSAALAVKRQEMERLFAVSRQRVVLELLEAINLAKQDRNAHAMIAGWLEIAKICGYYAPEKKQIELSVSAQRAVEYLETLSDAELLQLAETDPAEEAS